MNQIPMNNSNIIDSLYEDDMLYCVMGSLISAETLIDAESCRRSLDSLELLKIEFLSSKLKDDPKIQSYFDNAERIIKRDLEDFSKQ